MTTLNCPLCLQEGITPSLVENRYAECPCCALRFLSPEFHLNESEEKERYLLHTDDVNDKGYEQYLWSLYEAISQRLTIPSQGLDYGCGRASVLGRMLEEKGHSLTLYDPFFKPNTNALKRNYDFVFATEVIEHFFHPALEFQRLRALTKPGGFLGIMTRLCDGEDFENWFYRRDPTHVSFFSQRTFNWIAKNLGWTGVTFIGNKTILLC
jgi:hypothetical protein